MQDKVWIAVAVMLLMGQTAQAQPQPRPSAPDGYARVLDILGMASAEAEARAGVESYRVFFVNGYGVDRPAIAFERRPGQPPKAVVYASGGKIETPVSAAVWDKVSARGELADRTLAPAPPRPGEEEVILCLHGWATTVEIVEAPAADARTAIRRRTENSCNNGLTTEFGAEASALALAAFPACQALALEKFRNDVERLALCALLRGDTVAAGQLASQIGVRLDLRRDLEPVQAWQAWMGTNALAELDWAGKITKDERHGDHRVATFLAARDAAERLYISPGQIKGLDSRTIEVTGRVDTAPLGGGAAAQTAPYEQLWIWDKAGRQWMLKAWKVERFAPLGSS